MPTSLRSMVWKGLEELLLVLVQEPVTKGTFWPTTSQAFLVVGIVGDDQGVAAGVDVEVLFGLIRGFSTCSRWLAFSWFTGNRRVTICSRA
jgi:predicted membrane-bound spermidine synthase